MYRSHSSNHANNYRSPSLLRLKEMSTSPETPQRRWVFRLGLLLVLVVLVLVGSDLEFSKNTVAAPSTITSTTPAQSSTPSTTTTSTTTTLVAPVTAPLAINQRAHGCGFAMQVGSATTVPVRAVGHCTVLEIGDSIGSDLGWGLARELSSTPSLRLVLKDKSSSGLAASWYYNWPRQLRAMLAHQHPDLVIVCVGGDDEQGIRYNGRSYNFNTPPWRARYASLIQQMDTMATKAGSYVLWVGLPIMEPTLYRAGIAAINSLGQSVAATVPGVTFLSSWGRFANSQGHYRGSASVNHVTSALRASDGIHFTVVGENVFATFVAQKIAEVYHVHLRLAQPAFITN